MSWVSIPESELILRVQNGEGEAFAELASRYIPFIHRIANPYRSSLLEAEDLSQEGLLGLLQAAKTYRQEGAASFSTYAGICISNRIVSAYRKEFGKKNEPMRDFVSFDTEEELGWFSNHLISASENPEALLINRENLDRLFRKIRESLTDREYQVLSRYAAGFSYQEISEQMGISVKSVGNAMQRARKKLRQLFR